MFVLAKHDDLVNIKVPASILNLFKRVYNLPDRTYNKDVLLYAIASSLPENGRYLFAEDYKLDKQKIDEIINKRQYLANENSKKDITKIDKKLERLESNHHINQLLIRLLLADNFSLGTDENILRQYLQSENDREIMNVIKNMVE